MLGKGWRLIKESVYAYVDDNALSKGAAIAYYTVTSLAPVLIIIVAIAGLAFGQEAARGEISGQISGMMGKQSADLLQSALAGTSNKSSGIVASIVGVVTLLITASGVFTEMQSSLNAIWRAKLEGTTVSRLIRARLASLGLVAALGLLLLLSLVVSAAISALGGSVSSALPFGPAILRVVNVVLSIVLISMMFAAIYKVLPDRDLTWKDVIIGAVVTALLFTVGKSLISLYIGSSSMASGYGAAGGLLILLVWIYYSAQIFLFGAEFTKVYASTYGSLRGTDAARSVALAAGETRQTPAPSAARPAPDGKPSPPGVPDGDAPGGQAKGESRA